MSRKNPQIAGGITGLPIKIASDLTEDADFPARMSPSRLSALPFSVKRLLSIQFWVIRTPMVVIFAEISAGAHD